MEGYRLHTWGSDPTWERFSRPEPGPREVEIDVEACGVGLTVLNCINGDLANDGELLPRVPGHELVGRVVGAGPEVPPGLVGRRVVAYFYLFCGACGSCLAGFEPRCERLAGWIGVHVDGGYAPRCVLPESNVIPIPDTLDPVDATVVPDAVATPVHVAGRAGIGDDDLVVVIGAGGGVGVHMVQVAAARGAAVVGVDVEPAKLAALDGLGVVAVDGSDPDAARAGLPAAPTVVVDFVGTDATTQWGLDVLGMGGRLVALTTFRDRPVPVEARDLVFRELDLLGSRYATRRQVAEAAGLVASGAVRPIIGAKAAPQDVLGVHRLLESRSLVGRGVIDWRELT